MIVATVIVGRKSRETNGSWRTQIGEVIMKSKYRVSYSKEGNLERAFLTEVFVGR
jgi:hypothetical protein